MGRPARASDCKFLSGCTHTRTWVHGDSPAIFGEYGFFDGSRAIAEICSGPFPNSGHGFLAHADQRSGIAQSLSRRNDSRRKIADSPDRLDRLLSFRGRRSRKRYARDFATTSVPKGGTL